MFGQGRERVFYSLQAGQNKGSHGPTLSKNGSAGLHIACNREFKKKGEKAHSSSAKEAGFLRPI